MRLTFRKEILLSCFLGSLLILAAVSSIGSADAVKSTGTFNTKFGKDTAGIVCGDKLCSEIKKNDGRGNIYQQEAPVDPFSPLYEFDFNSQQEDISFDGDDGYLNLERNRENVMKIQANSTNTLEELTVTAWIEPNFEKSFGEYSIVGKERSFNLYVDNLNYPKKTADFSIYDGITWTTVKSKNILPETWFHLAAVFKKGVVSLYVNGELEGETAIKPIRLVNSDGRTIEDTVDKIKSTADLSIGTYLTTSKQDGEKSNSMFAGKIDDIQIFDFAMDEEKISEKYQEKSSIFQDRIKKELLADSESK